MINHGIALSVATEPLSHIELNKAVEAIGLVVFSEEEIQRFSDDLDSLVKKGEASALTPDEIIAIEKGKKDISKLTKKEIVDSKGRKRHVYVKVKDDEKTEKKPDNEKKEGASSAKTPEHHATNTSTDKLKEYIKSGTDEDLKKIASAELKKRGEYKEEPADKKDPVDSVVKKVVAKHGGTKDKLKEAAEDNNTIGKTKSGKTVYSKHDHKSHKNFSSEDHRDAADLHHEKAENARKDKPNNESLVKKHRESRNYHEDKSKEAATEGKSDKDSKKIRDWHNNGLSTDSVDTKAFKRLYISASKEQRERVAEKYFGDKNKDLTSVGRHHHDQLAEALHDEMNPKPKKGKFLGNSKSGEPVHEGDKVHHPEHGEGTAYGMHNGEVHVDTEHGAFRSKVDKLKHASGVKKGFDEDLVKAFGSFGIDITKATEAAGNPLVKQDLEGQTKHNKTDFSAKERKALAKTGEALPDGSYPIRNSQDLKDAIKSVGLGKNEEAAKAHIKKRAKALGKESLLPDSWS